VFDRLLQAEADINSPAAAHSGRTVLQTAAAKGHLAMVDRLLRHEDKVDINTPAAERLGRTALQAAAQGGYLVVVDRLLHAGADIIPVEQLSRPSP
jgi:ankyrin repeat protein